MRCSTWSVSLFTSTTRRLMCVACSVFIPILMYLLFKPGQASHADLYDYLKATATAEGRQDILNALLSTTRTKFDSALVYALLLTPAAVLLPLKLQALQMSYETIYKVSSACSVHCYSLTEPLQLMVVMSQRGDKPFQLTWLECVIYRHALLVSSGYMTATTALLAIKDAWFNHILPNTSSMDEKARRWISDAIARMLHPLLIYTILMTSLQHRNWYHRRTCRAPHAHPRFLQWCVE